MTKSLKIAICEDTAAEEKKLLAMLETSGIPTESSVFHNAENLLKTYEPQSYDLVLMDIYMDGMNGVEAVKRIREVDQEVPVAFVTTSQEFALESYRLNALKYIEKPYGKEEIEDILQLALLKKYSAPGLIIHKNGKEGKIRFQNILYLEVQGRHLLIHLKDGGEIQITEKMSVLLPQLEGHSFFYSHKSFCVNLNYVQYIDTELKCFLMENGTNVPIRRESMPEAKKALEEHLFKKTRGQSL